jgi:hypothetical protein
MKQISVIIALSLIFPFVLVANHLSGLPDSSAITGRKGDLQTHDALSSSKTGFDAAPGVAVDKTATYAKATRDEEEKPQTKGPLRNRNYRAGGIWFW